MKIVANSKFKKGEEDLNYFRDWIASLENQNGYKYDKVKVDTLLGNTQVYGFNLKNKELETIVIFPGYRTTALIWDLDNGLKKLSQSFRIFLIETNGQPNLSDGNSPAIKSCDYGHWVNDLFNKLGIEKAYTVGASFGALICMKFAITNPEKVKATFLLNAGCLQPFSLSFSNLYYNLLPVLFPTKNNVSKFLDKAIFSKPNHKITAEAERLLNEYLLFCLKSFKDKTEKPYYMNKQLSEVVVDTYLLHGDKDILFPFEKSIRNAKKHINSVKGIKIFTNVGHGIETMHQAIEYIEHTINTRKNVLQQKV